jgi:flagellar motility protein MotE (MotC chaperone)
VKQKQKKELERVQAVSDHTATQHEEKIRQWKERFAVLREEVAKEKEKWIKKYNNLETQLSTTKDRVYAEKAKCRSLMQ